VSINAANILAEGAAAHARLAPYVRRTPLVRFDDLGRQACDAAMLWCKFEHLQKTGSFKARGALNCTLTTQPRRDIVAFSAGNHAIAAAFAAQVIGVHAKVIMPSTASPLRIARARAFGGEIVLVGSGAEAAALAEDIARDEQRLLLHPFEHPAIVAGAASLGLEIWEDAARAIDAVIVAVGGGGLAGGVAGAIKALAPNCAVYGVEPEGAANMRASLDARRPLKANPPQTIADSLAPPFCLPYSFAACQAFLDDVVTVSDSNIVQAMKLWRETANLVLEPAAAAPLAAVHGPLRDRLAHKRVALVLCGANISARDFSALTETPLVQC
jgi:threonine dehydratase